MMSIVTTGPDTGYYVDVFRSRKERGGDKMHDYFYHNLGQSMTLTAVDGTDMNLQPTEELAFAGAGERLPENFNWQRKLTLKQLHSVRH